MNVFHKVTIESLKKNRARTAVTIIGVILSAAMMSAVTTLFSSLQNYLLEDAIYNYGNWHGVSEGKSYGAYEIVLGSDKVEAATCLQQLGYAVADGCQNEYKPYLYVLGAGGGAEGFLPIHITSGTFPDSPGEILLPEHLFSNGGVRYSIGDKLSLSLGERVDADGNPLSQHTPFYVSKDGTTAKGDEVLKVREMREYVVTGFYERLPWSIEDFSAPGYTAFTAADLPPYEGYAVDIYFRMKNPGGVYEFMREKGLYGDANSNLLRCYGIFKAGSTQIMLFLLAAIAILLILFGSVSLIYNAFSISVSERVRQFGLLSSVGATARQLRRMVLYEAMVIGAIGIPVGILCGIGGIGATLYLIGDRFKSLSSISSSLSLRVTPWSIIVAAAVSIVTVLLSAYAPSRRAMKVSAIDAIRMAREVRSPEQKSRRKKKKGTRQNSLFGLPGFMAERYYKRSKRKYRATVLSLFMSIVLFVSATSFADYLTELASGRFSEEGCDLLYAMEPDELGKNSPDDVLSSMASAQSVTGCSYALEKIADGAKIPLGCLSEDGIEIFSGMSADDAVASAGSSGTIDASASISFLDDSSFRSMLADGGIDEDAFFNSKKPLAVAIDGVRKYDQRKKKYAATRVFSKEKFSFSINTGEGEIVAEVGAITSKRPDAIRNASDASIVYPASLMDEILPSLAGARDAGYSDCGYTFTVYSSDPGKSETALKGVMANLGLASTACVNLAKERETTRNFLIITRVFAYGFIVLISLIAAANVFNTISTNVGLRRREFAMLRSVGMMNKELSRMMGLECLLYGSRALLFGIPASCAVTYLIYLSVMEGYVTKFRLPWGAMGIAAISVFAVVFSTMLYALGKIREDNLIDALKNENL